MMQGKTPTSVPEIRAPGSGAVAKLMTSLTNDTLAEKNGLSFALVAFEPVLPAIEPKSRATRTRSAARCTGWRKKIRRSVTRSADR
jgi:hypothetical protein